MVRKTNEDRDIWMVVSDSASAMRHALLHPSEVLAGHPNSDVGWQKRSFLSKGPTPPRINRLARTKTPGKTFAVLAGFCHTEI